MMKRGNGIKAAGGIVVSMQMRWSDAAEGQCRPDAARVQLWAGVVACALAFLLYYGRYVVMVVRKEGSCRGLVIPTSTLLLLR